MGQQAESYLLNHLVDTSFSGSVTRTTGIVAPPNTREFAEKHAQQGEYGCP